MYFGKVLGGEASQNLIQLAKELKTPIPAELYVKCLYCDKTFLRSDARVDICKMVEHEVMCSERTFTGFESCSCAVKFLPNQRPTTLKDVAAKRDLAIMQHQRSCDLKIKAPLDLLTSIFYKIASGELNLSSFSSDARAELIPFLQTATTQMEQAFADSVAL
jgi:hypothetical protein